MNKLPKEWSEKDNKLFLAVKCDDFKHALALVNSIGDIAERHQHHPDLGVRNYNEVFVSTTTHEAGDDGKITEKDYKLAKEISDLINYEDEKHHIALHGRE